jgi:hypothetical protein
MFAGPSNMLFHFVPASDSQLVGGSFVNVKINLGVVVNVPINREISRP